MATVYVASAISGAIMAEGIVFLMRSLPRWGSSGPDSDTAVKVYAVGGVLGAIAGCGIALTTVVTSSAISFAWSYMTGHVQIVVT
jgi:hypothetical protein